MATAQVCHKLTSYYLTAYQDRYGVKPNINRHKARWGFDSVLEDLSAAKAMELIDFYLAAQSSNRHSLEWFFYNYDKLIDKKETYEKDEADRRKLRAASKKKVEEWRKQKSDNN